MKSAKTPENEEDRLVALDGYQVLDTLPEKDFDNITKLAAYITGTPISLVSLIDEKRQWFKSHHGLDANETPRELAFCAHAINKPNELFTVEDARLDERFSNNPLVMGDPNVIFYAGMPLTDSRGHALGTLCVIDNKPKKLDKEQQDALRALAGQVINILDLRKTNMELQKLNNDMSQFVESIEEDLEKVMDDSTKKMKAVVQDLLAFRL